MTTSALPLTDGYNEMPWTCTGCGIAVDPGYYTGPGTSDPTKCAGHRVGQWRKCGYPVHYYKKGTGPQYDPGQMASARSAEMTKDITITTQTATSTVKADTCINQGKAAKGSAAIA